ncbi:hypothetical protein MKZ38_010744 [Zalerion maritima]|uniref:Uncharacterized protein n=1 Tax=Zalerion maritima TaxID=339359 RepID=A0AAD5S030_9PEZI|nr:hypothetical protein MKZ38_010744 [Zalerion maritima]
MMVFPIWRLAVLAAVVPHVQADANMTPDYEVKLLMDPSVVLGTNNKLTATVLSAFSMPTTVTKMNVQFLDTDALDINTEGWSVRIRKKEDEDDFELTYKKRYSVSDDDVEAALDTANEEGFDEDNEDKYDAQIEYGYSKKTLSISRKKSHSDSGYSGMDLPDLDDSIDMLVDEAPGKFVDWVDDNWGTDLLEESRIYGPVLAKRSIGIYDGEELYIEVWPILNETGTGVEYLVEASFKVDTESNAATKQASLETYLTNQGWFLAGDALKTSLMLERY